MKSRAWLAAFILFPCTAPSWSQVAVTAQPAPAASAQRPPTFGEADVDHDGRLKRSEIPHQLPMLRARFNDFDTNHNGYLEPNEIVAYLASSEGRKALDMNRITVGTPEVQHPLQLQSGHGIEHD